MPLLARLVLAPLFVDVRRGAVEALGEILADARISAGGHVAVVVGRTQGPRVLERIQGLHAAESFVVSGGSIRAAGELEGRLREGSYDAVVGVGGGRTLDTTKWAASRLGLPMVAVATNLAHDGIASPVSSLVHEGGKGSYGVTPPIAVVVDLDDVAASPPEMVRSGIGDAISNLSAIADWELARDERREPVDGLAMTFARTAAESLLHRRDGVGDDGFLTALAEALVLSGMAMSAAGTSRPCSGGDHEILHAVEQLYPGTSNHGELAGIGALFCFYLRQRLLGEDGARFAQIESCLRRHQLACTPGEVGLSAEQFTEAVLLAPSTRPDRFTVIEHLDLAPGTVKELVESYVAAVGR